jgi:hypothetical protein
MPAVAVSGLRGLLDGAGLMIEYGSGGSTIMAASLGVQVVSVETDHHFADAVNAAAAKRGLAGVRVLKADLGWTMEWGYPFDQYPTRRNLTRWRRYVEAPWAVIGDRRPDLILIDGRFRKAYLAGAVSSVCGAASAHPSSSTTTPIARTTQRSRPSWRSARPRTGP